MSLEDGLRAQGIEVHGTFNPQNLFNALAGILSEKYGVDLDIRAVPRDDGELKKIS